MVTSIKIIKMIKDYYNGHEPYQGLQPRITQYCKYGTFLLVLLKLGQNFKKKWCGEDDH